MRTIKLGKREIRVPAVCASVTGRRESEVRRSLRTAERMGAEIIEMRLDLMGCVPENVMPKKLPTIITNRPKREGGGFSGSDEERVGIIIDSLELSPSCIDLEISTPKRTLRKAISKAKQKHTAVILSHHDFSGTPNIASLNSIIEDMTGEGCDIAKIVTTSKTRKEAFGMLEFLLKTHESVPTVAFAMGEEGVVTRYVSLILGSPWTYAGVNEKTAPGQLDLKTAVEWVEELRRLEVE